MRKATLRELASLVNGEVVGDDSISVTGVSKIERSIEGTVSFLSNPKYEKYLENTKASAVLVGKSVTSGNTALIKVEDPYLAFRSVVLFFHPFDEVSEDFRHETAIVSDAAELNSPVYIGPYAIIEEGTKIGPNTKVSARTYIGRNVRIGSNVYIHPAATIMDDTVIGNNVTIHSGSVIGSDGFGYARKGVEYLKIPQIGNVVIKDDADIGANCTIDRAAMGSTVIGKGSIIDNLVMIAHNVTVGDYTAIAAQTGIAGSSKVGDRAILGGQVGITGHVAVGNDAILGAKTGVTNDIPDKAYYFGYPAREHRILKRIEASLTRLPDLIKRVRKLESDSKKKQRI